MNSKTIIIGVVAVLFLGFSIWAIAMSKQSKPVENITLSESGQVYPKSMVTPSSSESATLTTGTGSAETSQPQNTEVVLVEFGDLQCPACKAYEPTLKQIRDEYASNLTFIYKHFPLPGHKNAFPAAVAAEAASRQGSFWEYHDILYEKQEEWAQLPNPEEKFVEYAKSLELDTEQFKKDLQDKKLSDIVNAQKDEGGKIGVNATPTFYVNGKYLEVNNSFESFKKAIDEVLSKN